MDTMAVLQVVAVIAALRASWLEVLAGQAAATLGARTTSSGAILA
jgi:hypothetical protein